MSNRGLAHYQHLSYTKHSVIKDWAMGNSRACVFNMHFTSDIKILLEPQAFLGFTDQFEEN
jgi:hypothetical protein